MDNQDQELIDTFISVYKYGTYYSPAWKHYGKSGSVGCDRCLEEPLNVSVGWMDYDLCLSCLNEIDNLYIEEDMDPEKWIIED